MKSEKRITNFVSRHSRLGPIFCVLGKNPANKSKIEQCAEIFSHVIDRNACGARQFRRGTSVCTHRFQNCKIGAVLSNFVWNQESRFLRNKSDTGKKLFLDISEYWSAIVPKLQIAGFTSDDAIGFDDLFRTVSR